MQRPASFPTVLSPANFFNGSLTGWGLGQAGQQQQEEEQRLENPLSHVAQVMQYVLRLLLLLLLWPLVMIFEGQSPSP